jgi:hypothetical protein
MLQPQGWLRHRVGHPCYDPNKVRMAGDTAAGAAACCLLAGAWRQAPGCDQGSAPGAAAAASTCACCPEQHAPHDSSTQTPVGCTRPAHAATSSAHRRRLPPPCPCPPAGPGHPRLQAAPELRQVAAAQQAAAEPHHPRLLQGRHGPRGAQVGGGSGAGATGRGRAGPDHAHASRPSCSALPPPPTRPLL